MAQIFPKWTNEIPKWGTIVAVVGAVAVTGIVWYWFSPKHTDVGYMPTQPVPYSHALHAGQMQMDCRYCHANVDKGQHAGVPPTQTCMNCHTQVRTDSPLLQPIRDSWAKGEPMHWVRIHKLPDYAYFNHSAHVGLVKEGAAVGCTTCHGRVDQMVVVKQEQPLSMSWCIDCHSNPAPNLRPIDKLTDMTWTADAAWTLKAQDIASRLNPPGSKSRAYRPLVDDHGNVVKDADGNPQMAAYATAGCTGCHR